MTTGAVISEASTALLEMTGEVIYYERVMCRLDEVERLLKKTQMTIEQARWTVRSYKRNAIPNIGWMVKQGPKLIMRELAEQAAIQLAKDHNNCLLP